LWRRILGGSTAGLRNLYNADLRSGIVSNDTAVLMKGRPRTYGLEYQAAT